MNKDVIINQLAHVTGKSRKEVIAALKEMSKITKMHKELGKMPGKN